MIELKVNHKNSVNRREENDRDRKREGQVKIEMRYFFLFSCNGINHDSHSLSIYTIAF